MLLSDCAQLANILSTEALFYACIFPFIAFFGSFAFVLYPLRDTLHPTGPPLGLLLVHRVSVALHLHHCATHGSP